ncbi:sigma-54-dependent Fis family transcriptional regulator [Sulfurimicrobium lacus]|uniref:Sigma-54-dependent Fis family transcriptional regulator n=1 Tax=Sulfurimicrobium lacus TaxID=2715678 RepID=A0A6F8VFK2_9PROT|nr:sigma-54 dependent transcriptional regulator [Sulfurimicrobium lacus]BCB27931.1 sigma-54-dependent Fis family transcriptional regulator [Sulfurimicrobium lacus]
MQSKGRLLIVEDEKIALKNLVHVMTKEGYDVAGTQSGATALGWIESQSFDVVLTDLRMEKVDGMQVLKKCRERSPDTEVIMITGHATPESAVEAMKSGAFFYIAKPFRLDDVRKVVREALEKNLLKRENRQLREQIEGYEGKVKIITQDPAMLKVLEMARQVAPTDCNVLITGESGTGKELFARYLHYNSGRADGPFVAVNCGAFGEELLSNELFGHEKGAFTGALTLKKGLIESAQGGTLFLDEITEMSPAMQVKLLRVIQEREVLHLGGTAPVKTDARYIAATNRDIETVTRDGSLRQDLFFRLNVVNLHIPPLCERKGDVAPLSYYFLKKFSVLMKKEVNDISPEAISVLENHDFPGNVRELENIIERGVAINTGQTIELAHLPEKLREASAQMFRKKEGRVPSLEAQEKAYIRWVLNEAGGNQTVAAQMLGINRVSLWRKLKSYEMDDGTLLDGTP